MSQTKKIQNKIFHGNNSSNEEATSAGSRSSSEQQPSLTINIPKPAEQAPAQQRPKLTKPTSADSPKYDYTSESDPRSFRERLAEQLGDDYKGAERFRLEQDVKKDMHWKRWGPYLSERQWVCLLISTITLSPF